MDVSKAEFPDHAAGPIEALPKRYSDVSASLRRVPSAFPVRAEFAMQSAHKALEPGRLFVYFWVLFGLSRPRRAYLHRRVYKKKEIDSIANGINGPATMA